MFLTDDIIYIQMQKTGCSHIAMLLSRMFKGQQIGKHNPATEALLTGNYHFISSIRNPWDWYLSLWTYGVQGKGGLHDRLVNKKYRRILRHFHQHPLVKIESLIKEMRKDTDAWREVYADASDVELFRRWLKMIHAAENASWLGENYVESGLSELCGFMSHRYLSLCCSARLHPSKLIAVKDIHMLADYERHHCHVDDFIRQESLEDDLCKVLERLSLLRHEDKSLIYSMKKTNASHRYRSIGEYYDKECAELVGLREKIVIDKFDYQSPM